MRSCSGLVLVALAGCSSGGLVDPTFATGSATAVVSSSARMIYTVNADDGTVSRYDAATNSASEVAVGAEPTRIARVGDRLLVTLRGERGIAVLRDDGTTLVRDHVVPTGAEPFGIVASEDGSRVFVALSTQNEVDELDGSTLTVLRTWQIAGEPRWIALHPSGKSLFVAAAYGGVLSRIDLGDGTVEPVPLPDTQGVEDVLTRRLTGDPSISPDGGELAVPALYVDNLSNPQSSDFQATLPYYASAGPGVSRLNPSVILADLGASGQLVGQASAVLVTGVIADPSGNVQGVRSFISGTSFAPDGQSVWAPMEGSGAVAVVSTFVMHADQAVNPGFVSDTAAGAAGFDLAPTAFLQTAAGPRSVVFAANQAFVHDFLSRSVDAVSIADGKKQVEAQFNPDAFAFAAGSTWHGRGAAPVAVSSLPVDVEQGRMAFYTAVDGAMSAPGSGVSCSTCHFDGRNDGLTWHLDIGPRNTPSLAGQVSQTAPVTWTNDVAGVGDEVMDTTTERMGGEGPSVEKRRAIAAFVDYTRLPDLPRPDASAAARGRAIFERDDAACATCHSGAVLTDRADHPMFGLRVVNTPTLLGVGASAPYFHDGSAATLRDVIARSDAGAMGDTSRLTDAERDDLIAYLQSL